MKITVLTENPTADSRLIAEHGLSLFIEANERRVLFDFGQSDAFARNAAMLGVNIADVDIGILSHGHYDHGGGIACFLEANRTAPVYLSHRAFCNYYNGTEKYIGLSQAIAHNDRIRRIHKPTDLGSGLTLLDASCCPSHEPIEPYGLTVKSPCGFVPEQFFHEQCLLVEERGLRILISGCSHRGVLNWLHAVKPDVFIGGFHFMKLDPNGEGRSTLDHAAAVLQALPCRYYTGHCTGEAPYDFLKAVLGDRLQALSVGLTHTIV